VFPSSDDDLKNIDIDDDENIKNLGELLSNQTSRDIIKILVHNKMHPSAICQNLGIKSNVLTPHLKKMETVNMFEITNEKIIRKGKDHRFFHISPSKIVIVLRKPKKDNVKRFPKKIVKSGVKFASIGIIGLSSYLISFTLSNNDKWSTPYHESIVSHDVSFSLSVALSLIIVSLVIERIWFQRKK